MVVMVLLVFVMATECLTGWYWKARLVHLYHTMQFCVPGFVGS